MASGETDNLVAAVADRVREALLEAEKRGNEFVEEAERRAEEIVAEAEERARRIVADADAKAERAIALAEEQARERVDRARVALEELGSALGHPPAAPEPAAAPEPEPELAEEPEPVEEEESEPDSEPEALDEPKPAEEAGKAEGGPSTDELIAQLRSGGPAAPADGGDEGAARLIAMNMALDGASREDVDRHLSEEYGLTDNDALLDEVFDRVR